MIQCEWGDMYLPHSPMKRCLNEAKYVIKFIEGHPIVIPFQNYNFVCEEHIKEFRKRKLKMVVYEFIGFKEKVEFT